MRNRMGRSILCLALGLSLAAPLRSQSPNDKLRFEVASVRLNVSGEGTGRMQAQGDRFTASCVPFITLLRWAYRPPNRVPIFYDSNLLIGLPGWAASDCFDVQAKAEAAVPVEQLEQMLQSLLEERFQLKVHRETREASTYHLVVAASGHKMKLSDDQTPPGRPKPVDDPSAPPQRGVTNINMSPSGDRMRVVVSGTGIAMDQLANRFQGLTGRPVIDKTGLKELFDINVQATFDQPERAPATPEGTQASTPGPPVWVEALVFKAIQDQLGLKLESVKGTIPALVIESVQKPSSQN